MKRLTIPKTQKDIKVSTYLKFESFIKELTDEQKEDVPFLVENTVKIFYSMTDEDYSERPYTQILDMNQIINNILTLPSELIRTFKVGDVEYGINPDLTQMNFAELCDLDTIDVLQQICILYRPIKKRKGDKYIIEKYKANIETYDKFKEELTLDIYLGFVFFFLNIAQDLLNYTLKSIKDQASAQKLMNSSVVNGGGIVGLTNCVTTT